MSWKLTTRKNVKFFVIKILVIQIILSNLALYHNCEKIVENSLLLTKEIQYVDSNLYDILKLANKANHKENNNENLFYGNKEKK